MSLTIPSSKFYQVSCVETRLWNLTKLQAWWSVKSIKWTSTCMLCYISNNSLCTLLCFCYHEAAVKAKEVKCNQQIAAACGIKSTPIVQSVYCLVLIKQLLTAKKSHSYLCWTWTICRTVATWSFINDIKRAKIVKYWCTCCCFNSANNMKKKAALLSVQLIERFCSVLQQLAL